MSNIKDKCAIIFGGCGFIGSFFAEYLINSQSFKKIYIVDIEAPSQKYSKFRQKQLSNEKFIFIQADIRSEIIFDCPNKISLIANFAAIHREPGHLDSEYFETNLLGAENICRFAEKINCRNIIFTSSISPYGISESNKDESTLPIPITPYGASKLVSEKIHQIWQAKDSQNRFLTIIRPGVVFGPGEGGNVTRLIRAVINNYFVYMGNASTRKAGIYIKELCCAVYWINSQQLIKGEFFALANLSMNPGPSVKEYVDAVCTVISKRKIIVNLPYKVILFLSYIISFIAKLLNIKHPFSPVRVMKLVRPNLITPNYLINNNYIYKYNLIHAFLDWKSECPEEWI
jgi:nucleoside-diphosphate-sugar epimerase